jgi:hypothetical protein
MKKYKMMIYAIGAVVLFIAGFVFYRNWKVNGQSQKLASERFERIKPLLEKFDGRQNISVDEVKPFAFGLGTRETTYELLKEKDRLDLFPSELLTIEKGAEANLATWLEFPTELDAIPDEIEHIKRVTIPFDKENNVYYHLFKFRTKEPHWAAKDGWMMGVVGPYFDDSKPYDFPGATFSRLSSLEGTITPEEEAKWVHENISIRIAK